jgi:hypothetical protein
MPPIQPLWHLSEQNQQPTRRQYILLPKMYKPSFKTFQKRLFQSFGNRPRRRCWPWEALLSFGAAQDKCFAVAGENSLAAGLALVGNRQ